MRKRFLSIVFILAMMLTMVPFTGKVVHAAELQAATKLVWDEDASDANVYVTWADPNQEGLVEDVIVYLYNTQDTTQPAASINCPNTGRLNVSAYLIPGDTYYFSVLEFYLGDDDDIECESAASDTYTVPGKYTASAISDFTVDQSGIISWTNTSKDYHTSYETVLYYENGGEWIEVYRYSDIPGDETSWYWSEYIDNVRTYKITLVGMQGSIQTTLVAETEPFTLGSGSATETDDPDDPDESDKLLAPTDLAWQLNRTDGTVYATWTNPNKEGLVDNISLCLYNTADISRCVVSKAMETCRRCDLSDYVMPGNTYYYELTFHTYNDEQETDVVTSRNYTARGNYTPGKIENLRFDSDGTIRWDNCYLTGSASDYHTYYESVLYFKTGDDWQEVASTNDIFSPEDNYDWSNYLKEGYTYKATLVGKQSCVDTTLVTETQEYMIKPGSLDSYTDDKTRFAYILDDKGNATITGYFGNDTDLNIPSVIDGHPVKTIGEGAFSTYADCGRYKSVTIPESVTKIDDNAFYGCSGLKDITIPDSVTYIGESAFCHCGGFSKIILSANVSYIEEDAFTGTNNTTIFYQSSKENWAKVTVIGEITNSVLCKPSYTAPKAKELVYTGNAQELVKGGTATGGQMVYSLSKSGTYSTAIPKATKIGSYKVYYRVEGDDDHFSTEPAYLTVNIKLAKVSISAWENTTTGIAISWGQVKGAAGYYIFKGTSRIKTIKGNSTLSFVDTDTKNAKNGRSYTYYVQAYYTDIAFNGAKSAAKITYRVKAPEKFTVMAYSHSVTIGFTKPVNVSYIIYRSTSKKGNYKPIKTITSGTKYKDTGLKKGQTYYYKIKAYMKLSGTKIKVYSAYTAIRKVTVK